MNRNTGHPDSSWITRFLLFPSILIISFTSYRVYHYYTNKAISPNYYLVIADNLLVNLAATSALFFFSATMFQGSIKKAAQRELLSFLQDTSIGSSIRQSLLTPLTNNNLKEMALVVVRDFSSISDLFIRNLSEAKEGDKISILNTWIPQLIELEEFRNALKEAWKRGSDICILMVFPHSQAATLRSASVANDEFSSQALVKSLVIQSLSRLNQIAKEINGSYAAFKDRLQVRLYETLPSVSIYSIRVSTMPNNLMFVGSFLHGKMAIHGPQLAIMESSSFVARSFDQEFNQVWDSAYPFPLINQKEGMEDVVKKLDLMRSPDPFPDN
jgi:hypothetical protein